MARRRTLVLLGLFVALVTGGCAANAPQDSLDPAGPLAETIDNLFMPVVWVAVVVFVLVEGAIVYFVVRYRRRADEDDDDDEELPVQFHGSTKLEITWTVLPALVLGLIAVFTIPVIFELEAQPAGALEVDVTGQKYWWGYSYEPQPAFGIEEGGIVTANELHIPAGEPVLLSLTSPDVIHSFWTPRLNGKRDVVPGRVHTWSIHAFEPGVYSGQCAEFCGASHANMRLKVVAHDQAGWDDWVEQMQRPLVQPISGPAADGFELFAQAGCAACHRVAGAYDMVADDSPASPDLTKLFTRDCFAGCIYDLDDRNELEAWLRNPQRKAGSLMVIGELTEEDIDSLYAYLETLE